MEKLNLFKLLVLGEPVQPQWPGIEQNAAD
jgi:hypothetical protein